MRIKKIEIKNYKAFYQDYEFDVSGKNLFIYGENGSGKSSFYYALKDFFQSSVENISYRETENIFLTKKQKDKGYIRVTFNPDKDGNLVDKPYVVRNGVKDTYVAGDTSIRDAIKLKSFLTYKHLLGIHSVAKGDEIDLFPLLINGVLKHFRSAAITGGRELGELWDAVNDAIAKPLAGSRYNISRKKIVVDRAISEFNKAFSPLFVKGGIENILRYAQPILDKFGHGIDVDLLYLAARPNPAYDGISSGQVRVSIKYNGKRVDKPHLFLNEARLSALAISLYLGMVKRHIQGIPCKLLFLDDIFIGLDIGNRLPLLEILDKEFSEYQLIITTYDKPWYEFVRVAYLEGNDKWKGYEFYARRTRKGFEIPIIRAVTKDNSHIQKYIEAAEDHYSAGDNKAAGVYLRSAFEFILKRFCYEKVPVTFYPDTSKIKTDAFWGAVKNFKAAKPNRCKLTPATENDIDNYTRLVLNPLSHHDINKHEISAEVLGAIQTIKNLKTELGV